MGMQNDINLENDKAGFLIHIFKDTPPKVSPICLYREAILYSVLILRIAVYKVFVE